MRLSIQHICAGFNGSSLFDDFSLDLSGESPVVILGPSGCGKTTLLRLLAGILQPRQGVIDAPSASVMFQESRLFPHLSILENVMLPMTKALGKEKARERAVYYLEATKLSAKMDALPRFLSGGEQQRASMARAFTYNAPLLLLDEPFQSLDIPLRISLMKTLLNLLEKDNRFSVIVTHDPREALFMGKRIIVLGRQTGLVKVVLDEPNTIADQNTRHYINIHACEYEEHLISMLKS